LAQSGSVTSTDTTAKPDATTPSQAATAHPVNPFCPETGSHLPQAAAKDRDPRAVDCAKSSPGRVYSREEIEQTGATTTGQALRRLDPSIH